MKRRYLMIGIVVGLILLLIFAFRSCSNAADEDIYNFKSRKDDYFISEDESVIINYKTNELGLMIELNIDRLLSIEDMIYFNTNIDYDYELEGFDGDIYENAGFLCTSYYNFQVPINIEIGNTKFKYNRVDCEYQEVDRDNIYKTGSYAQSYTLEDTIPVSKSILISLVVYDESSIEKFVEIQKLPHTAELLGVYSIPINSDNDGFTSDGVYVYFKDMAVYEQIYLRYQLNETVMLEISGIPSDINLFDLDDITEITPLINNFESRYIDEITAMIELESEIGLFIDETSGETNEEETSSD